MRRAYMRSFLFEFKNKLLTTLADKADDLWFSFRRFLIKSFSRAGGWLCINGRAVLCSTLTMGGLGRGHELMQFSCICTFMCRNRLFSNETDFVAHLPILMKCLSL